MIISKRGQIWMNGTHQILIFSLTDVTQYQRLLRDWVTNCYCVEQSVIPHVGVRVKSCR